MNEPGELSDLVVLRSGWSMKREEVKGDEGRMRRRQT